MPGLTLNNVRTPDVLPQPNTAWLEWCTCIWTRFLSLARRKLRLCSANHRPGYWSNLPCDWPSTAWAYSEQQTENGPCSLGDLRLCLLSSTLYCRRLRLWNINQFWQWATERQLWSKGDNQNGNYSSKKIELVIGFKYGSVYGRVPI